MRALPPTLRAAVAALALLLLGAAALAQPATYRVPSDTVRVEGGTVTLLTGGGEVSYVPGLGWLNDWPYPAPTVREDGAVIVSEEVASALRLPRLHGVRFGVDGSELRAVLDVRDVPRGQVQGVTGEGRLGNGEPLELHLPPVLLPEAPLEPYGGIELRAERSGAGVTVRLVGPALTYRTFTLADPTRVVVDLAPQEPLAPREEQVEALGPGLTYRRFRATGSDGPSAVHLLEVAPSAGEFRVVGHGGEGRTVADWADGALAAINAGYFDPSGFAAIGLRRIDGGLLSLPSRNRAAVGFGPTGVTVARAGARVQVRVDGHVAVDTRVGADGAVELSRVEGRRFGDPRHGLLRVRDGRVLSNTIGPAEVPDGGYALSYDADLRPLAVVEPGAEVRVSAQLLPSALERSRWAVEAGPLLVADGERAFQPELEAFARGQRILDAVTQQAAFGVRADGTALMVVAERMRAADLVPLMLDLGARDALRLDSGSSATLFAEGRVLNRFFQRDVSDAIVLVPASEEAARPGAP